MGKADKAAEQGVIFDSPMRNWTTDQARILAAARCREGAGLTKRLAAVRGYLAAICEPAASSLATYRILLVPLSVLC